LSAKYGDAIVLLNWLSRLAAAGRAGVPIPPRAAELATAFGTDSNDTLGHIGDRSNALLDQIRAGLDYFAQPPGFTPLLRFSQYQQQASVLLTHAEAIQATLDAFDRDTIADEEVRRKMQNVLAEGQEQLQKLTHQSDNELKALDELERAVLQIISEATVQEAIVQNANEDFKSAVEREANNCSFLDVVTAIGAVVAAAASVYAAIAVGVIELAKARQQVRTTPRTWANDRIVATHLIDAGKSIATVQPAWQQLRNAINPEKPEAGKLVMLREDVIKMTEPFIRLPEAQALRSQVERFLELNELKNQGVIAYTQAVSSHDSTLATIASLNGEARRIAIELAITNRRWNIGDLYTATARYAFQVRTLVMRFLYQAHLSFQYWSLSNSSFTLTSDSLAALRARDASIRSDIITAFENLSPPRQRMVRPQAISFDIDVDPDIIRQFRKTGRFSFRLSPSQVSRWGMRQVYVDEVGMRIKGIQTTDHVLKGVITSEGRSGFVTATGENRDFIHRRISTACIYDLRTGDAITDGRIANSDASDIDAGIYWGVGAIGEWSVKVLNAVPTEGGDNVGLDRSGVTQIEVLFSGRFASPA